MYKSIDIEANCKWKEFFCVSGFAPSRIICIITHVNLSQDLTYFLRHDIEGDSHRYSPSSAGNSVTKKKERIRMHENIALTYWIKLMKNLISMILINNLS